MMSIEDYKKKLESMSKEELISEIGGLLMDRDLLLNSRDGYIHELKEDNNRLNGLLADGTEVMDYWQDKYLEEKSKNDELQKQVEQLLEESVTINKNYLQECEEHLKTVQNAKELQKQVDNLKSGKGLFISQDQIDWVCSLGVMVHINEDSPVVLLNRYKYEKTCADTDRRIFHFEEEKEQAIKDKAQGIFDRVFETICAFTTQGKSEEYNKGFLDAVSEIDERLQKLAKDEGAEVE